jgi:hypothetical protein
VNFVYNTALSLVKLSVLLFYIRIFRTVSKYRPAFYAVGFTIVGWWIAIDFVALFTCIPIRKSWIPTLPGECINTQHTFVAATTSNILVDVLLLIVPMPMLWKLQVGTPQKFALLGIFACGYW